MQKIIIGLMSGTSVDGIDAALVTFSKRTNARRHLRAFVCVPWEAGLRAAILDACRPDAPLQRVAALNYRLGEVFAEAAQAVAKAAGVPMEEIDAIASHGQTIWHQPTPFDVAGVGTVATMQIGEPAIIAARTGCVVIADFRAADIAVGGQGAPLVPYADYALFHDSHETRVVQNLGGIANVTFLPAGGGLADVLAFDTGPGNILLDALISRATSGAQTHDADGALAAEGSVNSSLLEWALSHPYFQRPPPKTTGREMFGSAYAEEFLAKAASYDESLPNILATAAALTAESIARAYRQWLRPLDTVILGGGGVHNRALVTMLKRKLLPAQVLTHADFDLPDDAKEAVAFAILGHQTLYHCPSNVPSATGARTPAILGKICLPPDGLITRKLSGQ